MRGREEMERSGHHWRVVLLSRIRDFLLNGSPFLEASVLIVYHSEIGTGETCIRRTFIIALVP